MSSGRPGHGAHPLFRLAGIAGFLLLGPAALAQVEPGRSEPPAAEPRGFSPASQPRPVWYFYLGEQRAGPVGAEVIRQMFLARQLDPASRVWKEGMRAPESLGVVPELAGLVRYHLGRGNRHTGPFTLRQMRRMWREGKLVSGDLVWRTGLDAWRPLAAFPEIQPAPGPASAPAARKQRHRPDPPLMITGYVRRPRHILAAAGAIGTAVSWGSTLFLTAIYGSSDCAGCDTKAAVIWIPLAGPVLAYALDKESDEGLIFPSVLWSVAQALSITLGIVGLVGNKYPLYRPVTGQAGPTWRLWPLLGEAQGVGLSCTF